MWLNMRQHDSNYSMTVVGHTFAFQVYPEKKPNKTRDRISKHITSATSSHSEKFVLLSWVESVTFEQGP